MNRLLWLYLVAATSSPYTFANDAHITTFLNSGQTCQDERLGKAKDLNGYFPFRPPATREQWSARRRELREQILVATGLWPMPERIPMHPVIHGKMDRDDYTVEKVFFASLPGHYVSGNLYRPKGRSGKLAGVLCPHGHWPSGRFYKADLDRARKDILAGAEKTMEGATYPLQARCVQLARMGCIVFHYDMVGVADSGKFAHAAGFTDAQADLRLQSFMGLQTFNSIRALDFLLSIPEVDPARVGVTGASGGGTQTFILCAIDDRPTVQFPAVMVSTAMQGGCICENCSYLRQNTGNVEIAGLFAPKPLGMSAANDWTLEIETKGLPELGTLYKMLGAGPNVMAKCFPQFGHNYNQVSREIMYSWFNKHLHLSQPEPVRERPFVPVAAADLSVFDAQYPLPADASGAKEVRQYLSEASDRQLNHLRAGNGQSQDEYRQVIATALRVMIHDHFPDAVDVENRIVEVRSANEKDPSSPGYLQAFLSRQGAHERIPTLMLFPAGKYQTVVVWIDPAGKSSLFDRGRLTEAARSILDKRAAIVAPDVFLTGELGGGQTIPVNPQYSGYTFGYNRPVLANRVHDILTAIAFAKGLKNVQKIHVAGFGKAGPWVVVARGLYGKQVSKTAANANQFHFEDVQSTSDEMMLPGALKYGGLPGIDQMSQGQLLLYNVAPSDSLKKSPQEVVAWLFP